jgi:hypothetical protein
MAGVDVEEVLAEAPDELRAGPYERGPSYALARDLFATHGAAPRAPTTVALGGSISVHPVERTATDGLEGVAVGPVYRRVPGGGVAVPTGRALVRFGEGDSADRHRQELAEAGYDVEEALAYAPQAAWVRAKSGRITDTLTDLARLEIVPGVEHVEPQMVSERVPRT